MSERKHCPECALAYSDEASHRLVHEAVLGAAAPAAEPAAGNLPPQ